MAIFHIIILLLLLIIVGPMAAAAAGLGVGGSGQEDDECLPTSCRNHGPEIRFPFRLKGKQPKHCGYPGSGFDLSCTSPPNKYPVLELPFSVNVFVKKIDYKFQRIYISDPLGCFPRQLQNLNLSASPFQFIIDDYYEYDYLTVINCSSTQPDSYYERRIACLSDQSHQVYATFYDTIQLSCTKMYNMSIPVERSNYGVVFDDFGLNRTKPMCGYCEAQGKYCRLKNNNSNSSSSSSGQLNRTSSTECFDKPPSTGALRKLKIADEVLGSFVLVVFVIIIYLVYRSYKINKEDQAKIEKFLEDYKALKPARYSYAVIKKITINFRTKWDKEVME